MNKFSSIVVGSIASFAVIGTAEAGVYSGHTTAATSVRVTNLVSDSSNATDLQTSYLTLTYTSGAVVAVPLTVLSANTVQATYTTGGFTTVVKLEALAATQTRVTISNSCTPAAPRLKEVSLGTLNSRVAYDINPAVAATPGSLLGRAPTPVVLSGPWVANLQFDLPVAIVGAAPQGDLFNNMKARFTTPMDNGNFVFLVDTDRIN